MQFAKLDDSPMFRKQIQSSEESSDSLGERCLKFYKGCRKYTEGLGEGYDGDIAFASALETFGGGHNDPISVAFGGPVMTKFTIALREIGTYKEVLRSQVEHTLNDRLLQFVNLDLHDVKEARKRFDKASLLYDQARERFLSLRKGTRGNIAAAVEEELYHARSTFEQARFNLVTALSNVEAKKRFEFLEAVSETMAAHLRYFKQGYELLHQMEPYINQVSTYAKQSKERSNYELEALNERMQEYKRQIDRESRWSSNCSNGSPNGDGIQAIGRSSHKMIEAVMQSAAKGKVQTIRQGYLSKRSSNLRGDWKRRFFVLDSRGMLYYYRKRSSRTCGSSTQLSSQRNSSELGSGLLSRWLSSHYHGGGVHDEKSVAHHTVNLLTSTIKVDADQSDLRFCFRIISPTKNYTLQAESALDQMDWIEKITGVIASLLSSQAPEKCLPHCPMDIGHHRSTSESSSIDSADFDHGAVEEYTSERFASLHMDRPLRSSHQLKNGLKNEKPIDVLHKVCGNDKCADCGAPDPDWTSLNLGVLFCIECSGVHRNLGVHISKVRSLTLDVKVWEPSVINLFQSLGNTFANSVWEELLQSKGVFCLDVGHSVANKQQVLYFSKPSPSDSISTKEKFIHAKYAEKLFVRKPKENHMVAQHMWDAVRANDKKALYRLIVNLGADINVIYGQGTGNSSLTLAKVLLLQEQSVTDPCSGTMEADVVHRALSASLNSASTSEGSDIAENLDGWSLLHLACETADIGMIELLLQYGANINATDSRAQTPLHHCIMKGKATFAKLLLTRGADPLAVDDQGKTPLQLAVESNFQDTEYAEKLFVRKPKENHMVAQHMWDAVRANDKKALYRLIVNLGADINVIYGQGTGNSSLTLAKVLLLQEQSVTDPCSGTMEADVVHRALSASLNSASTSEGSDIAENLDGWSLLHLACETADIGMIELLLQYGANINATDSRAQTPLHHCIMKGKATFAKLLLTRGADPHAVDDQGKTPLQLAVESNFQDTEVLALLTDCHRH